RRVVSSLNTIPVVPGDAGEPVPSVQVSFAIQRISNAPLPRVKMLFGGAPCSVRTRLIPLIVQLLVPSVESNAETIAAVLKRTKESAMPLTVPIPFVAVEPETVTEPAIP